MRGHRTWFAVALSGGLMTLLTACPTLKLDPQRAGEIQQFSRAALTGSVSFLKGAPISALDAGRRLEQLALSHPQARAALQRHAPRAFAAFSEVRPQATTGCGTGEDSPVDGEDYLDVDQDGIPVALNGGTFTYTFDCRSSGLFGESGVLSGQISMRDTNDNDPDSGYTFTMRDFKFSYSITDNNNVTSSLTLTFNGSDSISVGGTPTAPLFINTQSFPFGFDVTSGSDFLRIGFGNNGKLTYSPTSTSAEVIFSQGYVDANNTFSYRVAFRDGAQASNVEGEFKLVLSNIYVDRLSECSEVSQSQETNRDARATFSDNDNNVLVWDIQGCGAGPWTYNGSAF
jgi:hypothetical protein